MQTPISFCLDLILDCKTIEDAHKRCRKYIRELESGSVPKPIVRPAVAAQAPSTQKILDEMMAEAPKVDASGLMAIATPKRIVGGEVSTGPGTKGPRKF